MQCDAGLLALAEHPFTAGPETKLCRVARDRFPILDSFTN
jgi:hypothetical protein